MALGTGGLLFAEDSSFSHPTASAPFSGGKSSMLLRGHPSCILRLCSCAGLLLSLGVGKGCDPGVARESDHVEFRERPWVQSSQRDSDSMLQ